MCSGTLKHRAWWGCLLQSQKDGDVPSPALSSQSPGYRPHAEFRHGDCWLLCTLPPPPALPPLRAPGGTREEAEAQRGHRLTQRTEQAADSSPELQSSSSELPLAHDMEAGRVAGPRQASPQTSGTQLLPPMSNFFFPATVLLRYNSHTT